MPRLPLSARLHGLGRALPWLVLIGSSGAGVTIARYEHLRQEGDEIARFAAVASDLRADIEARVRAHALRAHDAAALFTSSDEVTADEFRRWAARDEPLLRTAGGLGVAYARRVDGPAGPPAFPIAFVSPDLPERTGDVPSGPAEEASRRVAMEAAAGTGRAALTGAIDLDAVYTNSPERGFLVVVPVPRRSRDGTGPGSPLERCDGFVIAPVAARPLVATLFERGLRGGIGCAIEDGAGRLLARHNAPEGKPARAVREPIHMPGRDVRWMLTVAAIAGGPFDHVPPGPWLIVAAGLVLGVGLWGALRSVVVERDRAARAAASERAATQALRHSEERLRLVVLATSDAIWDWDGATDRVTWSGDLLREFGWEGDPGADAKRWWKARVHPDDLPRVEAEIERVAAGDGDRFTTEYRFRRADGAWAHVSDTATVVRDANGEAIRMVGAMVDRTPARRADEAREAQVELQRALFEAAPYPMWLYDEETLRFVAVNAEARRVYGWSEDEFRGMTIRDIHPVAECVRLDAMHAAGLGDAVTTDGHHCLRDGRLIDVVISSRRLRMEGRALRAVVALDVTGRRRLEEQFRQSQKMEAVGLLAGGVAHDFNNLLSVVAGYGEMLLDSTPTDAPQHAQVREICEAAERAAELTRKLLAFSRRQDIRLVPVDVNATVRGIGKILHRLVPAVISVQHELAPGAPAALADPSQLEQAVLNIVLNARDAMPGGGTITLRTRTATTADLPAPLMSPPPDGERFVVVSVEDTGIGMDDETVRRIFEPFFTTKEAGRGTGLGLSTVYGIVQQCKGAIAVESAPGRGSTFHVILPATNQPADPTGEIGLPAASGDLRSAHVLLAEDHDSVRDLVYAVLKRAGHRVLLASSGEQALAIAATEKRPFDVLVTDVVMPGIDGPELARRLRESDPGLAVVFLTGYADESVRARLAREPDAILLRKPIDLSALCAAIRPRAAPQ